MAFQRGSSREAHRVKSFNMWLFHEQMHMKGLHVVILITIIIIKTIKQYFSQKTSPKRHLESRWLDWVEVKRYRNSESLPDSAVSLHPSSHCHVLTFSRPFFIFFLAWGYTLQSSTKTNKPRRRRGIERLQCFWSPDCTRCSLSGG